MSSLYTPEYRDDRIIRMIENNPGRTEEECILAVDNSRAQRNQVFLSSIPSRYRDASVSDLGYVMDELQLAIDEMLMPPSQNEVVGVVVNGPTGSGKTYACYAVLKFLSEIDPYFVKYAGTYTETMSLLRHDLTSSDQSNQGYGSTWDRLINSSGGFGGLIFVDDLATMTPTQFELEKFLTILNHRIDRYLPFIFTTNIPVADFPKIFGQRIASRLTGHSRTVTMEQFDFRARHLQQSQDS